MSLKKTSPNETLSSHVTPRYLNPDSNEIFDVPQGNNYWVLVPGTPATCTQLGLFHHEALFPNAQSHKIDLVISGPNLGRNTTSAFALSSGTLGGALEAAVCGVRAMAISFAFFTRKESMAIVEEASIHSIKVIEKLSAEWHTPPLQSGEAATTDIPDVYTINTPLIEGVSQKPVKWTWMLDNKWRDGSLYKMANSAEPYDRNKPASFTWSPSFQDVWKTVEASPPGNDGLTIRDGCTSVTPLRANFEGLYGKGRFSGELKL